MAMGFTSSLRGGPRGARAGSEIHEGDDPFAWFNEGRLGTPGLHGLDKIPAVTRSVAVSWLISVPWRAFREMVKELTRCANQLRLDGARHRSHTGARRGAPRKRRFTSGLRNSAIIVVCRCQWDLRPRSQGRETRRATRTRGSGPCAKPTIERLLADG